MAFETPVLLLFFNRPDLGKMQINKLREVKAKRIYVSVDGKRDGVNSDIELVDSCCRLVDEIDWSCQVKTRFSNVNFGCGHGVVKAIDWFFENEKEGIILEDDCFPSNQFFDFCQKSLKKYRESEKVLLISGDRSSISSHLKKNQCYFTKYSPIWGWATWRTTWEQFQLDIPSWRTSDFNSDMLKAWLGSEKPSRIWEKKFDEIRSKFPHIDYWDYSLSYLLFKKQAFSLLPPSNLIKNFGFSNNATHTVYNINPRSTCSHEAYSRIVYPKTTESDLKADRLIEVQHHRMYFWKYIFQNKNFYYILKQATKNPFLFLRLLIAKAKKLV